MYLSFINTGASTDLSRHEAKNLNLQGLEGYCFCFLILPCFPKYIKFGKNFETKKPKQKEKLED